MQQGGQKGDGDGETQAAVGESEGGQPMQQNPRKQPGRAEKKRGKEKASGHTTTPSEAKGTVWDKLGYIPTLEDLRLQDVYRDWVYANPGTHLDGGIRNDLTWQAWWRDLVVMPSRRYDAPSGRVGRRFVGTLGAELKGVRNRLWNLERFIVFQTVILQQSRHVTASQAIRQRIEKRLDAWAEGSHRMLV